MSNRCRGKRLLTFTTVMVAFIGLWSTPPSPTASAEPAGWAALRDGKAFVIMRHALAPGTGDPADFDVDDCATQRNLSNQGRQQARKTGELFRKAGIETADVWTSAWCRCRDTAQLLALGNVRTLEPLNSFFRQRDRREPQTRALQDWIKARTSTEPLVLVSHQVNITALTGIFPASGELVFVEPVPGGSFNVIGRTQLAD